MPSPEGIVSGFELRSHGPPKIKGVSSSHYGIKFGTNISPAKGKDHDRCSYQRFDLSRLKGPEDSLLYGFGLYDGHGLSSAVADVASANMLGSMAAQCKGMVDRSALDENGASLDTEEGMKAMTALLGEDGSPQFNRQTSRMIDKAFSKVRELVHDAYAGQRVGSTATVVLVSSVNGGAEWSIACGWVGDSRAAVVEPGGKSARALTEDHRLDLPREKARVVAEQEKEAEAGLPGTRRTLVANRVSATTGQKGPLALYNEVTKVSTMVTRSLGDSMAASALSGEPEFAFDTAPDGSRLILASDGIWDVISVAKAASIIKGTKDARKAALLLCAAAKKIRLYGGHAPDDISAIVVNLDKSSVAPALPKAPGLFAMRGFFRSMSE
mmetsp:Transcript_3513/g.6479  ORF Transcript_3513/g.6479 Transcript_3513/m.6479 type:complete len:383 (-) Transcript_3513:292-1440(-)